MSKRRVRTARQVRRQEQVKSSRQRRREELLQASRQRRKSYGIGIVLGLVAIGMIAWTLGLFSKTAARLADPERAEQVAIGQTVYAQSCASCHGVNLEGQPNWQQPLPAGGLPAPPHDETGHTWHHSDTWLFKVTKFGGQSVMPKDFQEYKSRMPAFKDVLTDGEIWAVLAYIKNSWPADVRAKQEKITLSGGLH